MTGKKAKFKNSESFLRLVARRKACGLEELEELELSTSMGDGEGYSDRPFDEEEDNNNNNGRHQQLSIQETIPQDELFEVYMANGDDEDDDLSSHHDVLIIEGASTSAVPSHRGGSSLVRDFPERTKGGGVKRKRTLRRPFRREEADSYSSDSTSFGWKKPTTTTIHDQLPSAEEVKTMFYNVSGGSNGIFRCRFPIVRQRWNRGGMWTAAFSFFFVALLLLILIWSHDASGPATSQQLPSKMSGSNQSDHLQHQHYISRLNRVIDYLADFDAALLLDLKIQAKPQHQAAVFLVNDTYSQEWMEDPKQNQRFIERFALITMYYGMNGPEWEHSANFLNFTLDHCDWYHNFNADGGEMIRLGVECTPHGLVSKIDLSYNNLIGFEGRTLPYEIKNFKALESLQLHNNAISGYFPNSLSQLTKLKSLGMQYNKLEGNIPDSIGRMISLTSLGLGSNQLSGELPSRISNLLNLRLLGLDNNRNLEGDVRRLFGNLKSLQFLYLENNLIAGTLDATLVSNWKRMIDMDLSHNLIVGTLSDSVLNMPNLQILNLSNNQIDGSLPHDIFENLILEYLELSNNNLHGEIPFKLAILWNLHHLDLSGNKLTGTIPDTIGSMSNLRYLTTSGNNFGAQGLVDLSRLVDLKALSLRGSNIIGTIPAWFDRLGSLQILDLADNQLTGSIPSPIGVMEDLKVLLLSRNQLTGTLPDTLGLLSNLDVILLDGNPLLRGDTSSICDDAGVRPSTFVTSCEQDFDCSCCTDCCEEGDAKCANFVWSEDSYDPSWRYGFVQPIYNGGGNDAGPSSSRPIFDQIP